MTSMSKKKRIPVRHEAAPLADNPFAALAGAKDALPEGPAAVPLTEGVDDGPCPYAVARTKKGGWPVRVEKRPGGKVMTVVGNVSGDAKALLKALRKVCASGGVARDDAVEIQGDHRERIGAFLKESRGQ
jgi:translation initiation factor 1